MKASILVLPGDGVGPEVAAEGLRVLREVATLWGHDFAFSEELLGGCAIDATGTSLPPANPLSIALEPYGYRFLEVIPGAA